MYRSPMAAALTCGRCAGLRSLSASPPSSVLACCPHRPGAHPMRCRGYVPAGRYCTERYSPVGVEAGPEATGGPNQLWGHVVKVPPGDSLWIPDLVAVEGVTR